MNIFAKRKFLACTTLERGIVRIQFPSFRTIAKCSFWECASRHRSLGEEHVLDRLSFLSSHFLDVVGMLSTHIWEYIPGPYLVEIFVQVIIQIR